MKTRPSSLVPLLRSDTQGRILAGVMANPETEHSLTALAELAATSHPTVLREVDRAEQAGIVTTRRVGQTRLVRANPAHPLYQPLSQIVLATYGPPAVIAQALTEVPGIDKAYLFGSWAARYRGNAGRWPNDLDLLVVGRPDRDRLYEAAEQAEQKLGIPVQVTIRSTDQWGDQAADAALTNGKGDTFVAEVKSRPIVELELTQSQD